MIRTESGVMSDTLGPKEGLNTIISVIYKEFNAF